MVGIGLKERDVAERSLPSSKFLRVLMLMTRSSIEAAVSYMGEGDGEDGSVTPLS